MPTKPPRICSCGKITPANVLCLCERRRKAETDKRRPSAHDRGYDSHWKQARRAFLDKHPSCAMCGKPAVVVDHKTPHRGDKAKFWDKTNWQSLCAHHHNSTKQSQERKQ
ncbi:HNH endonuclease signature motif containing protein [Bradyrhizobium sp. CCBAU 25338]|uniref:HNH endonuclease signature motif containing protein n=1 Tax=Bradyrhizobium sp. CCBAU 25338 TaxID=1641877 RepID=UPI00230239D5|nr:HNH endonuclease [Bradyrhizobium sp. CCBAU 25338]MDA9529256.1 HNH endonuclease [Bradyrhizobium sp. CCBAU 25338]